MKICLITKNNGKINAAQSIFNETNIELIPAERDFPEIQSETSLEIARHTALEASKEMNLAAIREDHSLVLNFLGIPGPYTAYVEKKIKADKLLELIRDNDRTGYFEIATVYAEPNGFTKEFVYQVPIHLKALEIVKDPRGGWNGLLCLEGENRAFTEYPEEERLAVWNKNYKDLAEFLKSHL